MELMETSERPFVAVGGYNSLRSYYNGRFTGPGKLIGGLEARYAVLLVPSVVELKLVAFYDAGRVFGPGEGVRLTTARLHRAGGRSEEHTSELQSPCKLLCRPLLV